MIAVIVLIAILSVVNIYIAIKVNGVTDTHSNNLDSIQQRMNGIESKVQNNPIEKEPYIPVKDKDYNNGADGKNGTNGKDGVNGIDGKDSHSTHTIEKETIIKEKPLEGKTPTLRCNIVKNRWEMSYIGDLAWLTVKDTNNNPVRCIIGL